MAFSSRKSHLARHSKCHIQIGEQLLGWDNTIQSCNPESTMKLLLATLAILLLAGSIFADYKWRQWMAARKSQHHNPDRRDLE